MEQVLDDSNEEKSLSINPLLIVLGIFIYQTIISTSYLIERTSQFSSFKFIENPLSIYIFVQICTLGSVILLSILIRNRVIKTLSDKSLKRNIVVFVISYVVIQILQYVLVRYAFGDLDFESETALAYYDYYFENKILKVIDPLFYYVHIAAIALILGIGVNSNLKQHNQKK